MTTTRTYTQAIHSGDIAAITEQHREFMKLTENGWEESAAILQDRAYALGRDRGQDDWLPHPPARDVLAERVRQIETEGYSPERDDQYARGQLADAAGAYALWAHTCNIQGFKVTTVPPSWPWNPEHWKPTAQRTMLIKAGALILAEIERLDRQQSLGAADAVVMQSAADGQSRTTAPTAARTADLTDVLPTVAVEGEQLVIRITTECLLHAVTCASQWPVNEAGEPIRINDGALLIQEIIHELQRDDEQGTNSMHRLFDEAALAALDNGSEAVDYDEVRP